MVKQNLYPKILRNLHQTGRKKTYARNYNRKIKNHLQLRTTHESIVPNHSGTRKGTVSGGSYQIGTGDVIGICEICSDSHFLGYTTLEDTSLASYVLTKMEALNNLLQSRPSIAKLFLLSLFRQYNAMMEQTSVSEVKSAELYRQLRSDCEFYAALCEKHNIQPHIPAETHEIQACLEESPDEWLNSYYAALHHICGGPDSDILFQEPGLSLGMLRKVPWISARHTQFWRPSTSTVFKL